MIKKKLLQPWWLLAASLVALAFAQVGLGHARYMLAKELRSTQHELKGVRAEVNHLRLEWASLTRPERLRRLATQRLHMAPPSPLQVIQP